jgi:hypothetical protein
MFYALVHFPEIDYSKINLLRKKYDPTYRIIDPHLTLMFPVSESIGEQNLSHHLSAIFNSVSPFSIHVSGFVKSWDHWLFLTIKEGNSEVIQLYNRIYSGILASYKRSDITFIPHIGLGLFTQSGADYSLLDPRKVEFDQDRYKKALIEAESLGIDYHCQLDKVCLLKLTHNLSEIVWRREISLSDSIA